MRTTRAIRNLEDRLEKAERLLAEAQRLCLEYCPGEMSEELLEDWKEHQEVASAGISASIVSSLI